MTRPATIPPGLWPPRMGVEMSAGYCGERSAETFLRGVRAGTYPAPRIKCGRRQIWWKEDLDRTGIPGASETAADVAADL